MLIVRDPHGARIPPRTALIIAFSISGFLFALTVTMRWLHPPFLTLRDDGVYLPGAGKRTWRIAFADVTELRLHPPFMGCRALDMEAQLLPLSREHRWWSIHERSLPGKEAFDDVYSCIVSRVATPWCAPADGAFCGYLQFASVEQVLQTTVTVEGTGRFPYQIVLDALGDPAARDAFNPLGNLFSIGQIRPDEGIVVDVGGHEQVIVAPSDGRHALLLDVQPSNDVHLRFLEDEIEDRANDASD
jgi:hypothetical protein